MTKELYALVDKMNTEELISLAMWVFERKELDKLEKLDKLNFDKILQAYALLTEVSRSRM